MGITQNKIIYDNPVQMLGHIILCKNLNLMIFLPSEANIPSGGAQVTVNKDVWKNPDHYLMDDFIHPSNNLNYANEREIDAYVAYIDKRETEYVTYSEKLPNGAAILDTLTGTSYNIVNTLTVTRFLDRQEIHQRDDLIFEVLSNIFSKCKRLLIILPTDFVFHSPDCTEYVGNEVYIKKCWIDTSNNNLWIYIFHDYQTDYSTSKTLKIITRNLAFENPSQSSAVSVNYQFTQKMYSWLDQFDIPDTYTFKSDSDQRVYYKSTQTQTLDFTVDFAVQPPLYFHIPQERYNDQIYQFSNTDQYVPIQMEIQLPQRFANLKGSNYYHIYQIKYPSAIVMPGTQEYLSEVLKYRLICHINNDQKECVIIEASEIIQIKDQSERELDDIISIVINVIDPFNYPEVQGFKWSSDNGLGQYEIVVTNSEADGSNSQFLMVSDPMPFHSSTGSFENRITDFSVSKYATRLQGYWPNFLELAFSISSSSSIKYLVFEFHTYNEDNIKIYNQGTELFPGISSGDEYPCTHTDSTNLQPISNGRVFCTYYQGDSQGQFGQSHKIFVTNFDLTSGESKMKFLVKNPDADINLDWKISLKAYGNDISNTIFTGKRLYGWASIENALDDPLTPEIERTVGSSGNIQPISGVTVATEMMTPQQTFRASGDQLNILYSPTTFTADQSDTVIFKLPLRITGYDINVYENICDFGKTRDQIFYYIDKDLYELYAYYVYQFSAAPGAEIELTDISCDYYRVTNYNEDFAWEAIFISGTSKTQVEQYAMQVSVADLSTTKIHKWQGQVAAASALVFTGYTNFLNQDVVYSRKIIGVTNTYSRWELNKNLIVEADEGILSEDFPLTLDTVLGFKLSGNLWFEITSDLSCSVLQGIYNKNIYDPVRCTIETFVGGGDDHIWMYIKNFDSLLDYNTVSSDWTAEKNIIFQFSHDNANSDPASAGNSYVVDIYVWANEQAKNYLYPINPTTLIGHPQYYTRIQHTAPELVREYGYIKSNSFQYDSSTNQLTLEFTIYPTNLDLYNADLAARGTTTATDTTTLSISFSTYVGSALTSSKCDLTPLEHPSIVQYQYDFDRWEDEADWPTTDTGQLRWVEAYKDAFPFTATFDEPSQTMTFTFQELRKKMESFRLTSIADNGCTCKYTNVEKQDNEFTLTRTKSMCSRTEHSHNSCKTDAYCNDQGYQCNNACNNDKHKCLFKDIEVKSAISYIKCTYSTYACFNDNSALCDTSVCCVYNSCWKETDDGDYIDLKTIQEYTFSIVIDDLALKEEFLWLDYRFGPDLTDFYMTSQHIVSNTQMTLTTDLFTDIEDVTTEFYFKLAGIPISIEQNDKFRIALEFYDFLNPVISTHKIRDGLSVQIDCLCNFDITNTGDLSTWTYDTKCYSIARDESITEYDQDYTTNWIYFDQIFDNTNPNHIFECYIPNFINPSQTGNALTIEAKIVDFNNRRIVQGGLGSFYKASTTLTIRSTGSFQTIDYQDFNLQSDIEKLLHFFFKTKNFNFQFF